MNLEVSNNWILSFAPSWAPLSRSILPLTKSTHFYSQQVSHYFITFWNTCNSQHHQFYVGPRNRSAQKTEWYEKQAEKWQNRRDISYYNARHNDQNFMSNACNWNANVRPSLFLSPGPYVELWVPQPKAPNWKMRGLPDQKKKRGGGE